MQQFFLFCVMIYKFERSNFDSPYNPTPTTKPTPNKPTFAI